jgi:hypothetical protein
VHGFELVARPEPCFDVHRASARQGSGRGLWEGCALLAPPEARGLDLESQPGRASGGL